MSDTFQYRLGGITSFETTWRLKIDSCCYPIYRNNIANNALKFLVLEITLWLLLIDYKTRNLKNELILSLEDNTSVTSLIFIKPECRVYLLQCSELHPSKSGGACH